MLTSIKKSGIKRLKITEAVKNLLLNHQTHLAEIKEFDFVMNLGKSLIEVNKNDLAKVIDEDIILHKEWLKLYENCHKIDLELQEYKESINHCIMDCLVLLANEEDMLHLMNEYGIQNLFEIVNFQKYINSEAVSQDDMIYKSFMGEALINEKVTIILNQIIAVLKSDSEVENSKTEEIPDAEDNKAQEVPNVENNTTEEVSDIKPIIDSNDLD